MSLADIQSMKALKLSNINRSYLANLSTATETSLNVTALGIISSAIGWGSGPSQAYELGFLSKFDIVVSGIKLKSGTTSTQFSLFVFDANNTLLQSVLNLAPSIINNKFNLTAPLTVPAGGKLYMRFLNGNFYYTNTGSNTLKEYHPGDNTFAASPVIGGYDMVYYTKSNNSVALTDYFMPRYQEVSGNYGYIGRWFDKVVNSVTYKATNNQGSQICFKVSGTTSINVNFTPFTTPTYTPYFAYSIDGASFVRQLISTPAVTLPDTNDHIIRIIVDGMGENDPISGGKWLGSVGLTFNGVDVGTGTIKGILPMNRTIMFFGDSITEGINVLGTGANANVNSASSEYTMKCCQQINAIPYYVGYGGTGVLGDASFHHCLDAINYYYNGVPTGTDYPDVIVMAHGYNDYTLITNGTKTSTDFENAYNAVLDRLKIKYPGVPIVCLVPFGAQSLETYMKDCIASRNYCYLVESKGWSITTSDGVHPNTSGAITLGTNLATQLINTFGKQFFMG